MEPLFHFITERTWRRLDDDDVSLLWRLHEYDLLIGPLIIDLIFRKPLGILFGCHHQEVEILSFRVLISFDFGW